MPPDYLPRNDRRPDAEFVSSVSTEDLLEKVERIKERARERRSRELRGEWRGEPDYQASLDEDGDVQ